MINAMSGNGGEKTPEWAKYLSAEVRAMIREGVEDRKQAALDRKQAAEDRRASKENQQILLAQLKQLREEAKLERIALHKLGQKILGALHRIERKLGDDAA